MNSVGARLAREAGDSVPDRPRELDREQALLPRIASQQMLLVY
ncbi:hypothetical protein [Pseudomonas sp. FG-3G]|nr:hypothetical protein [Pseudomonas sp. FG-3G]